MKRLLIVSVLLLASCGYAPHKDPLVLTKSSPAAAQEAARLHAQSIGGSYHQNLCCGSMEPLIHAGDWIVTQKSAFSDALLGKVCDYQPAWHPAGPIEHRLVSGNAKDGFIGSGDNNATSEASERVTSANYEAEVVAVYHSE